MEYETVAFFFEKHEVPFEWIHEVGVGPGLGLVNITLQGTHACNKGAFR